MDELYQLGLLNNGFDQLYSAPSAIHGKGLFAILNLPANTLICKLTVDGHTLKPENWHQEPFKWLNHAEKPNAFMTPDGILVSLFCIEADEEITIDYTSLFKLLQVEAKEDENSRSPSENYAANPIRSFWMGGFECTDQLNNTGNRVDLLTATKHLEFIEEDYQRLKTFGMHTVREGIRWSKVEKLPYVYDFSEVKLMLDAAKRQGIQQLWDICHFGFPDDLSPLHPKFTERFVGLCRAFAQFHRQHSPDEVLIVTPINEVSFLSWLGGEAAATSPYCRHNGWEVKYHLMKAYIQGVKALKMIDAAILILTTEPLVNIVSRLEASPEEIQQAQIAHQEQYQAMDMLTGKMCPELGGSPELADIMGFNFYYNNQWLTGFEYFLPWLNEEPDARWRSLHNLLAEAYSRYYKPVMLSETSHPGEDRPKWIKFIGEQCHTLLEIGIPFFGICLYPVIDRPDWDNLDYWHHSGLWDRLSDTDNSAERVLNIPYAEALRSAQLLFTKNILTNEAS